MLARYDTRVVVPVTNSTAQIRVTIGSDLDIVVLADFPRFTNRAVVGPVLLFAFENLHHVTNDCVASVYGNGRRGPACALGVGQPVRQLPSLLSQIFQVLSQLLIATTATEMIHQ
ncbi:hypothetical protein D9M73_266800 [compost metagenome]